MNHHITPGTLASFAISLAANGCACDLAYSADTSVLDAGIDVGVRIRNDANLDAFGPDALLPPVASHWRSPTPPDCSLFQDNPPRWAPDTPVGEVGVTRWIVSSGQPTLGIVRTWDRPPTRASLFGPVLTGTGTVIWTWSDWLETGLDYETGSIVHFGMSAAVGGPSIEPVERNYTRLPRMWLPPHNAIYYANGWRGWPLRAPTFDIQDTPSPDRRGGVVGPTGFPGAWRRDSWMPSWSAINGDIVALGQGMVVSGCESGARWATSIPYEAPGSIFVRENGEVLVSTYAKVYVLGGDSGELLRSEFVGSLGGRGVDRGAVAAYQPVCGLLVEYELGQAWFWFDVDTMSRGPLMRLPTGQTSGTNAWSGTTDCGVVALNYPGDRVTRFNADGRVRYDIPVPEGTFGTILPPSPLVDGGTAMILPGGWYRISPEGVSSTVTRLNELLVGLGSDGRPILAPDGTLFYLTNSGGEYRASATPTGLIPGPYLWPNSGLNWARTNSILPD